MLFLRYLRRNVSLTIGLVILLLLILFTLIGSLYINAEKDPYPLAAPPRV